MQNEKLFGAGIRRRMMHGFLCSKTRSEMRYIHQNPVVSGGVYEAEQWVYSSAKDYEKK